MCIFTIYISEIIYIIIYIMFVYLKDSSIIYDIYMWVLDVYIYILFCIWWYDWIMIVLGFYPPADSNAAPPWYMFAFPVG